MALKAMQHITVELDIPNTAHIPEDYNLRDAIVALLYKQGFLSAAEAAEIMEVARRDVEDSLKSYGVAAVNQEQIHYDLKNIGHS